MSKECTESEKEQKPEVKMEKNKWISAKVSVEIDWIC